MLLDAFGGWSWCNGIDLGRKMLEMGEGDG